MDQNNQGSLTRVRVTFNWTKSVYVREGMAFFRDIDLREWAGCEGCRSLFGEAGNIEQCPICQRPKPFLFGSELADMYHELAVPIGTVARGKSRRAL